MIVGTLFAGVPRVRVHVVLRELSFREVELLVDPASARTALTTGDLAGIYSSGLPLDDAIGVSGIPDVRTAIPRAASLVFVNDDLPHQELAEILVVEGPPGASRLGRDVLSRWLMVYDEQEDLLFFRAPRSLNASGPALPRIANPSREP